ncbi:GtrA family protein [bacterium]|nr:GtrA family protein [bacterium]
MKFDKKFLIRFIKFSLVGLTGIMVNEGFLALFKETFGIPIWLASVFAIELSILSNFALNDLWTWRDKHHRNFFGRIWRYHFSVGLTAYGLNYPVLLLLTYIANIQYLWANLVGIALASIVNFLINHFWTYGKNRFLI